MQESEVAAYSGVSRAVAGVHGIRQAHFTSVSFRDTSDRLGRSVGITCKES
jgi:hypothetical protein